ncbi:MAG: hypothetical protein RKE49_02705 [Oceanicaulis sp.]
MNTALWVFGAAMAALMLASGVVDRAPMHTNAAVEMQTGPVILALAAPDKPVRLIAQQGCVSARCPLIELRVRREAAQAEDRVTLTTR